MPSDSEVSMNKAEILSQIDVAMGGHVAEKLIVGENQITSGCGSDLAGATAYATAAVRKYGMFGDDVGFATVGKDHASDEYNHACDRVIKQILDVSSDGLLCRTLLCVFRS